MTLRLQDFTLYLRGDKRKKNGKMPLYIRFRRINGSEPKFPLGIDLLPEEWSEARQHVRDVDVDILLQQEITRIRQQVRKLELDAVEINKELLRAIVSQKDASSEQNDDLSFYALFRECVANHAKAGRLGASTLAGYETTFRALKEFHPAITLREMNAKLLSDFDQFLTRRGEKSGKGAVEGSRYNRMKHIRSVLKFIEAKHIPIENPFRTGEITIKEPCRNETFLERKELLTLIRFTGKEIQLGTMSFYVMAMFLVACQTGLRLSDILSLKWEEIDRSVEPWVIHKVLKKKVGGKEVEIHTPIPQYAMHLIDWIQDDYVYMDMPERLVFPTIHPNMINKILRRIVEKAGIKKQVTFHAARRTYATNLALKGVDNKVMMRLMGHTNFNSTLRYTQWSTDIARTYAEQTEMVKARPLFIK